MPDINPELFSSNKVISTAVISECGKYRYSLTRIWDENKPKVMFVMLNPSTADADKDDPTIRRCIGFAKSWGFGGIHVCNLFAFRSTEPKELLKAHNPFGDQNIWHTRKLYDEVDIVVCAWGNKPILKKILKGNDPYRLLKFAYPKLHYLELSKDGTPKHPLYLRKDISPARKQIEYIVENKNGVHEYSDSIEINDNVKAVRIIILSPIKERNPITDVVKSIQIKNKNIHFKNNLDCFGYCSTINDISLSEFLNKTSDLKFELIQDAIIKVILIFKENKSIKSIYDDYAPPNIILNDKS